MTAVGFEPTPFRTSALSWRLRPLGHAVELLFVGATTPECVSLASKGRQTRLRKTTPTGFEPVRAEPIGVQVRLLDHSDTVPS